MEALQWRAERKNWSINYYETTDQFIL